ncbi:hypothetical protein ONS95_001797 [Cadophora gregata]|uniref:uncharacterized protein n=1 Tax=Cadophora gregata TaxID=51156 RepID=UPI0026DAF426|nr:uncharacterized protein ONS95_001797 [Cadophora gregata]KAK0111437.1 hypothetical protein ONS95_001797 [Cadophora gregata]
MHRLWSASLGRYPWPGSPALLLPPKPETDRASRLAADIYSLNELRRLPSEITTMIWTLLGQHDLLRFSTVLELVVFLSHTEFDDSISIPLHQVEVWRRGSVPVTRKDKSNSLIELTIDSRGIVYIERLKSSAHKRRSDFIVYTTIKPSQNLTIEFQFGIGRLAPIVGPGRLQITDTPNLANVTCFRFPSQAPDIRLATIDLNSCSGITFFMTKSYTHAIHAHTQATPFAELTFARLTPSIHPFVRWLYVPNPPADKISAFGVRLKINSKNQPLQYDYSYLIRTPHRGDFTVGPHHDGAVKDYVVYTSNQSALLYSIPENKPLSILGVTPKGQVCSELSPSPPAGASPLPDAFYASASLKNVACIWVFRDTQADFCRGLIIEYLDGSQQALGCCRLGFDPVERCPDLTQFTFSSSEYSQKNGSRRAAVKVRILPVSVDSNWLDAGWTSCSEAHTLQVWVTATEMAMNVIRTI